jgi:hypothetical protein
MSEEHAEATHVWCPNCQEIEEAEFTSLSGLSADSQFLGGDILCGVCSKIVASLYKERRQ